MDADDKEAAAFTPACRMPVPTILTASVAFALVAMAPGIPPLHNASDGVIGIAIATLPLYRTSVCEMNICEPCRLGRHNECRGGACDCEQRRLASIEYDFPNRREIDGLADSICTNLLASGSQVATMIANGAGREHMREFVRMVLRAYRAVVN